MYGNYRFSLTAKEQGDWQVFLRTLPPEIQQHPIALMLHDMSYPESWTNKPEHPPAKGSIAA